MSTAETVPAVTVPAETVAAETVAAETVAAERIAHTDLSARAADWRLASWRSFLRTHTHLLRLLEQDLQVNRKIAIASYDVLVQLAEAPDHRLRMSELAEAVLLSRSGLTRLVDRLQKDGLVERQPDPCDARGLFTVLTAKGRDVLRDAASVHLAGVSKLVLDRLTENELRQLHALMTKLDPVPNQVPTPGEICGLG